MTRAIRPDELYVAQTAVGYRPFVDGLRAISILAVVGYHVGLPGTTGGYVGVDVFFVISGFLIISQIIDGLHSGNFTFGEFWARRAFRILPTYLLVLAASVALSPFFLVMPEEFRAFSREVRDAGLMIINHLFLEQQGYFDRASDTKPLLHLWSLSVEEQFYLAAPCLLATLWLVPGWLGRPGLRLPTLFWAAVLVFSTSLAGCIVFTRAGGSNFGFYLTVLRAWEFVAGGACAFLLPFAVRLPRHVLVAIGVAGLAAIAFAVGFFQHDTLYPSWRALLPVLGSVAVIVAGLAHPDAMMMRLLATPSMVFIGLVSYAWYLWHWPLLAFARIRNLGERDLPIDLGIAVLSFVLAVATFYILEKPIRRWRRRHARSIGWRPVFAGVAACGLAAFLGYQAQHALAQRQDAVIASRYRPQETASGRYCDLMKESGETCLAEAEGRPVGLLIGDSQMVFARDVLSERMQAAGVSAASMAALACPPFLDVHLFMNDVVMAADCNEGRDNARAALRSVSIKPDYAILFAAWLWYGEKSNIWVGPLGAAEPDADQGVAMVMALHQTLAALRSYGVRRILIIGPTPVFGQMVPQCLYRADGRGLDRGVTCGIDRSTFDKGAAFARSVLAEVTAGAADVRVVDPTDEFCDSARCLPYAGDDVLIVDEVHLSDAAVNRVAAAHAADFEWAVGRAAEAAADQ